MRDLIEQIYQPSLKDTRRKVNRYEYEMRDAAHKIDIAELYIQLNDLKKHLEKEGMVLPSKNAEEHDALVQRIVKEDRSRMNEDIAESLYDQGQAERNEKTGVFSNLKWWVKDKAVLQSSFNPEVKSLLKEQQDEIDYFAL